MIMDSFVNKVKKKDKSKSYCIALGTIAHDSDNLATMHKNIKPRISYKFFILDKKTRIEYIAMYLRSSRLI